MTYLRRHMVKHFLPHLAAYVVLVLGLASTFVAWTYVARTEEAKSQRRFEDAVTHTTQAIEQRLNAYLSALLGARGFLEASEEVTLTEFRTFIESIEVADRFPGIQGIGFAAWVTEDERESHEARVEAEGQLGYRIWPAGPREVYVPIDWLEPPDWRNRRALGFDMYSEAIRREALDRARFTALPSVTRAVRLVQETDIRPQSGFLIYVPVYRRPLPEGLEARAQALRGFVYAPFRAGDLFDSALAALGDRGIDLLIYDDAEASTAGLLYRREARAPEPDPTPPSGADRVFHPYPGHEEVRLLDVAGRRWRVTFRSRDAFDTAGGLPTLVAIGGLLVTFLLFFITRGQVRARAAAELSDRRSALLADAGGILSGSLDETAMLRGLVDLVARGFVDGCVIDVAEPDGTHRTFASARPIRGATPRVHETRRELPGDHVAHGGAPLRGTSTVLTAGRDTRLLAALLPLETRAAIELPEVGGAIVVPLRARGRTLGHMGFLAASPSRFAAAEVFLAEDLGRLVASALDNAQLYRHAQEAVRVRDEFLSVASHELKTPLTALQLQVQSILRAFARGQEGVLGTSAIRDKAALIDTSVQRMSKLISSLLDIARITSGRLQLTREPMDLSALVQEVVDRFGEEAAAAECQLDVHITPAVRGTWDPLRLDQILTNLLSNAIKYGPGAPITVSLTRDDRDARLEVADGGIGIPLEDQARIFEQFERAVSTRNYGGFGLGLWIARQIVEAHGGRIAVASVAGEGATFTVTLPLDPPAEADADA